MVLENSEHNYILNELVRAVKTLQLYPNGHQTLDDMVVRNIHNIKKITGQVGEFTWIIDFKGIFYNNIPLLPGRENITNLTKEFAVRRINELTFTPDMTAKEYRSFLSLMITDYEDVREMGGSEVFLARKKVVGIRLNEMSYANLLKLIEEEEDKEEEIEEEELIEEEEEEDVYEYGGEDLTETPIEHLIKELRDETDFIRYKDLAVRISEGVHTLQKEEDYATISEILKIYSIHMTEESGLPESIRSTATEQIRELLTTKTSLFLVKGFAEMDNEEYAEVERILLQGGAVTQNILLGYLIDHKDSKARHRVLKTIALFGPEIRPEVEKRLNDDRWFAVRQMVSLLGEIGEEKSLDALLNAYSHPETRVKKEVLKAVTRIPSERSLDLLFTALAGKNQALQGQAISSLGILKDPDAIDQLGEIATKWETFQDRVEIRKEAIKALGNIKDAKAIPYLKKVLFAKIWINKEAYEELRQLAVVSLRKIGGPEVISIITDASKRFKGSTLAACKRALVEKE